MSENRNPDSPADMECAVSDGVYAKEAGKRLSPPYHIRVHTIRKRRGDVDGISAKAAIDGLVKAGILGEDHPEFVQKISFTQEKGSEEKTIITIEEV